MESRGNHIQYTIPFPLKTQKIPNFPCVIGGQPDCGSSVTSRDEEVDSNCRSFGGEGAQLKAQRKTVPREVSVNHGWPRLFLLDEFNRWHNHLDPMVRKSPWNESEEFVFIEAHKLHGNKWAEIAKMIPGR